MLSMLIIESKLYIFLEKYFFIKFYQYSPHHQLVGYFVVA